MRFRAVCVSKCVSRKITMKTHVEVICYKVRPLKNGEYPLMLRITKSRKRKYVSVEMSIEEKLSRQFHKTTKR